jgi:hypothetical protein
MEKKVIELDKLKDLAYHLENVYIVPSESEYSSLRRYFGIDSDDMVKAGIYFEKIDDGYDDVKDYDEKYTTDSNSVMYYFAATN